MNLSNWGFLYFSIFEFSILRIVDSSTFVFFVFWMVQFPVVVFFCCLNFCLKFCLYLLNICFLMNVSTTSSAENDATVRRRASRFDECNDECTLPS